MALLQPDRNDTNGLIIHVMEDPERVNSQLSFGQTIGA